MDEDGLDGVKAVVNLHEKRLDKLDENIDKIKDDISNINVTLSNHYTELNVQVKGIYDATVEKRKNRRFWQSQFIQIVAVSGIISASSILAVLKALRLIP